MLMPADSRLHLRLALSASFLLLQNRAPGLRLLNLQKFLTCKSAMQHKKDLFDSVFKP